MGQSGQSSFQTIESSHNFNLLFSGPRHDAIKMMDTIHQFDGR